ncbi:MAG: NAD(P)-binding domain-containing protein [Betaproteobacteria bacterium]|nr:NAD(P)-binding domain-containing protein [Betaproteobacteria bacterium]
MQIGIVGLDGLGGALARRLVRGGAAVRAFHPDGDAAAKLAAEAGVAACGSLAELVAALSAPRTVLVALPAGEPAARTLAELVALLAEGDLVADAAAGHFRDAMTRATEFSARGIGYVDLGLTGGAIGADYGFGIVLGGEERWVEQLRPVLEKLAAGEGKSWMRCGPAGAGHFVKSVQDRIEQGVLGTFAHGLAFLQGRHDFNIKPADVVQVWREGSASNDELLALAEDYLAVHGIAAGEPAPPGATPAINLALALRTATQGAATYMDQLLAAMAAATGKKNGGM